MSQSGPPPAHKSKLRLYSKSEEKRAPLSPVGSPTPGDLHGLCFCKLSSSLIFSVFRYGPLAIETPLGLFQILHSSLPHASLPIARARQRCSSRANLTLPTISAARHSATTLACSSRSGKARIFFASSCSSPVWSTMNGMKPSTAANFHFISILLLSLVHRSLCHRIISACLPFLALDALSAYSARPITCGSLCYRYLPNVPLIPQTVAAQCQTILLLFFFSHGRNALTHTICMVMSGSPEDDTN